MAETFTNSTLQNVSTSFVDVYQAPNIADSNISVLLSIYVCNKVQTITDVTLVITDSGDAILAYLASTISIPVDGSWEAIANKVILKRGQKIRALASDINSLDITISCLEVV